MRPVFRDRGKWGVTQCLVGRYKWNNIAHILLVKIGRLVASEGYTGGLLVQHVMGAVPSRGLFGNIIASFRDRKYIFLHSMRMISQGNRYPLFLLSKTLTRALQEHHDLNLLLQQRPAQRLPFL